MEQQIQRQRAKVQEGGDQPPILILDEHGAEGVEELEGRDDVALDEDGGGDRRGRPEACADGHFVEPLFQGELACWVAAAGAAAAEHAIGPHVHGGLREMESEEVVR